MRQKRSWYIPGMKEARYIWGWENKQGGGQGRYWEGWWQCAGNCSRAKECNQGKTVCIR